jgi:hypothetical protein
MSTRNHVDVVCVGTSRIQPVGHKPIVTVLPAEGRWVCLDPETKEPSPYWKIQEYPLSKKARQASACLKNIFSQALPSSR